MNIAYHVHYLDWFEYARTEALRSTGLSYKELSESGVSMPVIDLSIKYRRSVLYDDEIRVETTPSLLASGLKIRFDYRVLREDEEMATGQVTLCFLQDGKSRPIPAPLAITRLLTEKGA